MTLLQASIARLSDDAQLMSIKQQRRVSTAAASAMKLCNDLPRFLSNSKQLIPLISRQFSLPRRYAGRPGNCVYMSSCMFSAPNKCTTTYAFNREFGSNASLGSTGSAPCAAAVVSAIQHQARQDHALCIYDCHHLNIFYPRVIISIRVTPALTLVSAAVQRRMAQHQSMGLDFPQGAMASLASPCSARLATHAPRQLLDLKVDDDGNFEGSEEILRKRADIRKSMHTLHEMALNLLVSRH